MKILFLDIDGVLNCEFTFHTNQSAYPFDPYMSLLVHRIVEATGCKVVLSSSWRYHPDGVKVIEEKALIKIHDITPKLRMSLSRGAEVRQWLEAHPEVERYAILDDNTDFYDDQKKNFFKCEWNTGLTEEVAKKVIEHLQ